MTKSMLMMMAATSGCVATGTAATVYSETTGGDLSNNFSTPTVLTSGTDTVIGAVNDSIDREDHFIITDLMPGDIADFVFSAVVNDSTLGAVSFSFTNSTNGDSLAVGLRAFGDADPGGVSFTVPSSGDVRITVTQNGTSESGAGGPGSTWSVSTNDVVPEPSVPALAALGALLAMRRKRN